MAVNGAVKSLTSCKVDLSGKMTPKGVDLRQPHPQNGRGGERDADFTFLVAPSLRRAPLFVLSQRSRSA
jgi:hypothetical protein